MNQEMTIQQYLDSKNIDYKEQGKELLVKCLFNGCDDDSRSNEYHLNFNKETSQYHCFKCDTKGNLITLMKHLGDSVQKATHTQPKQRRNQTPQQEASRCQKALTKQIKDYLINERGLDEYAIEEAMLGYGQFYGHYWITIPVRSGNGVEFLKLRKLPWDESNPDKYKCYPSHEAALYNAHMLLRDKPEDVVICEGELDVIMTFSKGLYVAVSSTAGANTFKEDWLRYFEFTKTVWLCFDQDEAGEKGIKNVTELFKKHRPDVSVMNIRLPAEVGEHGDITDYFKLADASPDDLFGKHAKHIAGEPPIDVSQFTEMTMHDLSETLNQTIKFDIENKCIVFLGLLTAYTEQDQLNVFLNGPSSSGKTYLATEVARYFPPEDVEEYAAASPTAFIHRRPKIDRETGFPYIDCERKILLFLELPHHKLQANLRPLLSHDKKEILYLTTEKEKSGGNTAKESRIRGFPATLFCSTSMHMDEQEATRAILLSPEVSMEKLKQGIELSATRNADPAKYKLQVELDPKRQLLEKRIRAIKRLHVNSVIIPSPEAVLSKFQLMTKQPKPRHQRDIAHLESLIKAVALLNAWFRLDANSNVIANDNDTAEALALWQKVSESQELGIPPYAHQFYKAYIKTAFEEKNANRDASSELLGVTRMEIGKKHFELTRQMPNEDNLRKNIIPTLVAAGLIVQEKDPSDAKRLLVYPKEALQQQYSGNDKEGVEDA